MVKSAVNEALTSSRHLEAVREAYNYAFESDPQLKRLTTFQAMLGRDQGKLHNRVTEALLDAKQIVDKMAKETMRQMLYSTDSKMFSTLRVRVSRCIAKHVIQHVMIKPIVLHSSFQFTEDDRTAELRADLMQKLVNCDEATSRINNIEREFSSDSYEDEVMQSLLNAAEAFKSQVASAFVEDFAPQLAHISIAAATLYDDLDLHKSGSPASGQSAQIHAELEEIPVSPVASDFSYINAID